MKLVFVRHGETKINRQGLTHSWKDPTGLTVQGKAQIKKILPFLEKNQVEVVYFSPETRTGETASLIARFLKIPAVPVNNLRERNWGEWQGRPWNEILAVLEKMTLEKRFHFIPPGGESWQQLEERLKTALTQIVSQKNRSVCIVTHGGALRGLMPILKNAPRKTSLQYHFPNAAVTVFNHINGRYHEMRAKSAS